MPVDHKEIAFEAAIEHHLTTAGGYVRGDRDSFDPHRSIFPADVLAFSKADFSAKVSISYKECQESKYWLCLLKDTGYLDESAFTSIHADADELGRILFAILKTTRIKPANDDNCSLNIGHCSLEIDQ